MRAKWGQNFLTDEAWQKKIISHFQPPHSFGEIGPGQGALTQHLERIYEGFHVFEIDPQLFHLHSNKARYQLHRGSFLDWDFSIEGAPVEKFSLIGNLPYESASHMIRKVLLNSKQISHFVFLVQKEVAVRVQARTGQKEVSTLSVLTQGQYEISLGEVIPPGAFRPAPKVDSQVIVGRLRPQSERHPSSKRYYDFVQKSFQKRRKQLINVWKPLLSDEKMRNLQELSVDLHCRAEQIPLELWPKLYQCLDHE